MLLEPAPVLSALSSRPLTLSILGLTLLAGGCDRQSTDKAQPQASASATAPASQTPAGAIDRSHKGSPLPAVTVTDPSGRSLPLGELKGPVLINLWATWCAPCVTELPQLDKLAAERAGTLRVVTVSEDMGEPARVAEFLKGKGAAHLEPWIDAKGDLPARYGGGTLPTTIYFDAAGKEVWRYVGGHDWTGADTAKMLAEGT
ncbi:MAG: TlpA disulfide reductase family protein [Novosphingobium sp.]